MILITGLGPGDMSRIPGPVLDALLDESKRLIIRTAQHPAAIQLAEKREVEFCDDLYDSHISFEALYSAIADRVIEAAARGPVVYAVPGGPSIGEFAVKEILRRSEDVQILNAETFVDAILVRVGYDPFERGLQILNGHELPSPLVLDKPTIVGHLDRPEILADVAANLARVVPEEGAVRLFAGLGSADEVDWEGTLDELDPDLAGFRTSLWLDVEPGGLVGAVKAMQRLRSECPWDREQTHQTLTKYLVEESFELIEAVSALKDGDLVGYARVEEEVGDVLLQVLFQSEIAAENGAFDVDDAAEVLRQKLVRRHPHVFGDVEVAGPEEVKANWDLIKQEEKGSSPGSPFDGIPEGMPALHLASKIQNRAAKAGLADSLGGEPDFGALTGMSLPNAVGEDWVGDVLFGLVDIARHNGIDPEIALRRAIRRFEAGLQANHPRPRSDETTHMTSESP